MARWGALVMAAERSEQLPEEDKALLRAHIQQHEQPHSLLPLVQFCTCQPTHDNPRIIRVQWVVSRELDGISRLLQRLLVINGGVAKYGAPPRGAAERAVAQALGWVRR